MEVQPDFKELFVLLNSHKVKYLVVGGYALAFYGFPRFTGDIDVFIQSTPKNSLCIIKALTAFGFGSLGLSSDDFLKKNTVIQLGVPPVRIDILTSLTGLSWEQAYKTKVKGLFGNVPVFYIGRREFMLNKRMVSRKKDQADLEALGE